MAVRPAVWPPGAASGRPHERPMHQSIRSSPAVHRRRSRLYHRRCSDHRPLGGHRVVSRRPRTGSAEGCRGVRDRVLDS